MIRKSVVAGDDVAMNEDVLAGDVVATPIESNTCCYTKCLTNKQARANGVYLFLASIKA